MFGYRDSVPCLFVCLRFTDPLKYRLLPKDTHDTWTLPVSKTVQESTPQQPLTLFQGASIQGGNLNISVNALNERPTLFLRSPRFKKERHFVIESDSD